MGERHARLHPIKTRPRRRWIRSRLLAGLLRATGTLPPRSRRPRPRALSDSAASAPQKSLEKVVSALVPTNVPDNVPAKAPTKAPAKAPVKAPVKATVKATVKKEITIARTIVKSKYVQVVLSNGKSEIFAYKDYSSPDEAKQALKNKYK